MAPDTRQNQLYCIMNDGNRPPGVSLGGLLPITSNMSRTTLPVLRRFTVSSYRKERARNLQT
jgi:hypothetical protein